MDYRRWSWTTCHWLGYYTAGLYHVDHEYLNIITGMKCCANSFVFTGQPDSPITNHTEECSEMEWWSFKDAEITEGWFRCPPGMFLKGFRLSSTPGLHGIRKAQCCKPHSSPNKYAYYYTHKVQRAGEMGAHTCTLSACVQNRLH